MEERKNEWIEELKQNHERTFMDMKNYYHSITADNIYLIDELKVNFKFICNNPMFIKRHLNKQIGLLCLSA